MKQVISTDRAPAAIGPYSQAVETACGKLVFVSGQIPLNPETMEIVGETAGDQCRQIMTNMAAVLDEAELSFEQVVKTTIYLADLNDFAEVNEVYATYFPEAPPARATVEVSRLPLGVRVEIDCIAVKSA
jgi:2-iminobutanoate/2-iminopropanoate deaminase